MKLYVFPPSPRAFKVLALANHLGLGYELKLVDLTKGEQLRPEFAALNPNKKIPVLEDNGFVLWESNAIIQYLAGKRPESGLLPSDSRERAEVNRWQFWEMANWDPACITLVFERVVKPLLGLGQPDTAKLKEAEENFQRYAEVLNGNLKHRKFVAGDALTVADFSIGAWMNLAERASYPVGARQEIRRWYSALIEMPAWRESISALPA